MYNDGYYHRTLRLVGADAEPLVRLHATLQDLLPALADHEHYILLNRPCGVSPQRILALPWHPGRLADARRRRQAGSKPPPLKLTRIRLPDAVWYQVSDGMHRAWAAREAGVKRIGAYVDCEVPCDPARVQLRHRYGRWELWEPCPRGLALIGEIPPTWLPVAQELGVALYSN
jgi:hypothetical protein